MAGAGVVSTVALLVCAAALVAPVLGHTQSSSDVQKLKKEASSLETQKVAIPDPGVFDCFRAAVGLQGCYYDIYRTVVSRQLHLGRPCCRAIAAVGDSCLVDFLEWARISSAEQAGATVLLLKQFCRILL